MAWPQSITLKYFCYAIAYYIYLRHECRFIKDPAGDHESCNLCSVSSEIGISNSKINIRTHVNEAVWFRMFDDSGNGGHQSARAHGHYDSVHIRQLFEDLYGYTAVSR